MNPQSTAGGALALLGSEGVEACFEAVWRRILGDSIRVVNLLPIASHVPGLVFQSRLELAETLLSNLGHRVQIRSLSDMTGDHAVWPVDESGAILVSVEMRLAPEDDDSPGRAAFINYFTRALRSGSPVIAGATAAAELGSERIEVSRPLPARPADAAVARSTGLGFLDHTLVMPFFEQIPSAVLGRITRLFDSSILMIGIDQNAALVIESHNARCVGLGKVTLLRDNGVVWVGTDGEAAPAGLIALNLDSHR